MKIRFKYIYIFAFIFVFENVFSQIQNWAQWESAARPTYTAGTAGTGERAYAVSVSPVDNSVYTVGTYNATNLTANFNLAHTSTGDGFIVKHNSAGVFQWSRKIGSATATSEIIYGVDVDPSGNVYVIGQFGGTVDFDPSAATYNLATAGGTDIFLAKYSSAGNFLWAVRAGGGNNDIGYEVKADGNAVYITGNYNAAGAAFTSFGSATVVNLTSAGGNSEIFCAKYSTAGVVQWAAKAGSSNNDTGYDITTDGSNVFLIGEYYNAFTIYNSSNVNSGSLTNQGTSGDVAIISYNSTGGFNWATNISSNSIDYGRGICTDGTNLYVTGGVRTNANFKHPTPDYTTTSSSGNDAFIASIEIVSGVFNWAKTIPGSGTLEYGTAIAYHPAGRIFITGQFNSNINFTSLGGTNFNSSTGIDVFAAAFTTNGNFYFANRAGSTSTDIGWAIDVDDNGDAVVSGEIGSNSSFPPITAQSGVAAANIFTAKLGCGVVMPIPNAGNDQTVCSTTATMAATAATVGVGTWTI
ncbi:MAG: SBBP repeat-containing protein, partial [Bacteroidia bacterium]|nr:SBBP repeat-containing protein [Bacteroidia bacterium]